MKASSQIYTHKHLNVAIIVANGKYWPAEPKKHVEWASRNSVGDLFNIWLAWGIGWELVADPNSKCGILEGCIVRFGSLASLSPPSTLSIMWPAMPKMEHDQQRLELPLPSTHYISCCKSLAPYVHPQPLPGWCWILPTVPCFCAVTIPSNFLRNPGNHPLDLPSNQQNQHPKYGSEPWFVSQIIHITTQEPKDGFGTARTWYLNITSMCTSARLLWWSEMVG